MIIKCDFCGGALEFDPDIQMMVCKYCSSVFPVTETELEKQQAEKEKTESKESEEDAPFEELMDCQIYECKSCGAKLMLSDVETATFCAYCGQPTVVFERIARRKRPRYIIPFSISKKEAIARIRSKFQNGKYIPDEIKNFQVDLLRGIYVPYLIYDIYYKDKQIIEGTETNPDAETGKSKFYFRQAVCDFREIPVDASVQLPDEASERLEPFDTSYMQDFRMEYLTGYYADLRDEKSDVLKIRALSRAIEMFNQYVTDTVRARNSQIIRNHPKYAFEREDYALFPIWFMVFHQNGQKYTIMVNGQSGKVVGAVPYNTKKLGIQFLLIAGIVSTLAAKLFPILAHMEDGILMVCMVIFLGIPWMLGVSYHNIRKVSRSLQISREDRIQRYASERQGHTDD